MCLIFEFIITLETIDKYIIYYDVALCIIMFIRNVETPRFNEKNLF